MAKAKRRERSRAGLLPGESRRRSLVTVDRGLLDKPGEELHHYVVSTRRLEGAWTHQVEYRGQVWEIPAKVVEALNRHRESVIAEERSRRAKERLLVQAARLVG